MIDCEHGVLVVRLVHEVFLGVDYLQRLEGRRALGEHRRAEEAGCRYVGRGAVACRLLCCANCFVQESACAFETSLGKLSCVEVDLAHFLVALDLWVRNDS